VCEVLSCQSAYQQYPELIQYRLDKYTLVSAAMARKSIALILTEQQQSTSKVTSIPDNISDWCMVCADHAEEAVHSDCRLGALLGVL